jgi:hypothetical protein
VGWRGQEGRGEGAARARGHAVEEVADVVARSVAPTAAQGTREPPELTASAVTSSSNSREWCPTISRSMAELRLELPQP